MFALSASGGAAAARIVRGVVLHPATARTTSGTGTITYVGDVSSGQKAYAALHVIAASGSSPTLDVAVQSDGDSSFGSPTDRITFSQASAVGAEWKSASGAISDSYWRVSYTIGGSSPSFTFVVVFGIR